MPAATLFSADRAALEALSSDLRRVFGNRLQSICAYGAASAADADIHSIALVDRLDFDDLAA